MRRNVFWMIISFSVLYSSTTSCVENGYDLTNINTDNIGVNISELSVPFGKIEPIRLDSLLKESDVLILDKEADYYCFRKDSSIDDIHPDISTPKFKINVKTNPITADLGDTHINPFSISSKASTLFKIAEFTLNDFNCDKVSAESHNTTSYKYQLPDPEKHESYSIVIPQNTIKLSSEGEATIHFQYTLPKEIKKVDKIYFDNAQPVNFTINVTDDNNLFSGTPIQKLNMQVNYPEGFMLKEDPNLPNNSDGSISVEGKTLNITGATFNGNAKYISFLLDSYTVQDEDYKNGMISINKTISYSVNYTIYDDEPITLTTNTQYNFGIDVTSESILNISDFVATTNDISASFNGTSNFKIATKVGADVSKIHSVSTSEQNGILSISIDKPNIGDFKFIEDSTLLLKFPKDLLVFNAIDNGIITNQDINNERGEITIRPSYLGKTIQINIAQINPEKDVENDSLYLDIETQYNGHLAVESKSINMNEAKSLWGEQTHNIELVGNDIRIENAYVETNSITTSFCTNDTIKINETIDKAVKKIKKADIGNDSYLNVHLTFTDIDGNKITCFNNHEAVFNEGFSVALPKFVITDGDINSLFDGKSFTFEDGFNTKIRIKSLDFSSVKANYLNYSAYKDGYIMLDTKEGNAWLNLGDTINIDGSVCVPSMALNSSALPNQIVIHPEISLDSLVLSTVYGEINPEINVDPSMINLDLSDDLDFLSDPKQNHSFNLTDPQIELTIQNNISLDIDLDIKLTPYLKGLVLAENIVEIPAVTIHAGSTDGSSTKTNLLISKTGATKLGYDSIRCSNLSNILNIIPDSIGIDIAARVKGTENVVSNPHIINLENSEHFLVTAAYQINVPLLFDDLNICYADTIENLMDDIDDVADYLDNATCEIHIDAVNKLPFDLEIEATPLSEIHANGQRSVLEGITIDSDIIKAHCGENENDKNEIVLKIKKTSEADLSDLDAIIFNVNVVTSENYTGEVLKGSMTFELNNVRLVIKNGRVTF